MALNGAGNTKYVHAYLLVISLLLPEPLAAVCLDGTLCGCRQEEKTGSIFTHS